MSVLGIRLDALTNILELSRGRMIFIRFSTLSNTPIASALFSFNDIQSDPDSDTELKYLKYKMKYLQLKEKLGL